MARFVGPGVDVAAAGIAASDFRFMLLLGLAACPEGVGAGAAHAVPLTASRRSSPRTKSHLMAPPYDARRKGVGQAFALRRFK
jgi:hypothetical protein